MRFVHVLCLCFALLFMDHFGLAEEPNAAPDRVTCLDLNSADSHFIQNVGQIDPDRVLFYSNGGSIFFCRSEIIYRFREVTGGLPPGIDPFDIPSDAGMERGVVLRITFPGSDATDPSGIDRCSWESNFFYGSDPSGWRTGVPNYNGVVYRDLWDGIDLVYRLAGGIIKYDIIIHPGADTGSIRFKAEGQDSIFTDDSGDLEFRAGEFSIKDSGLKATYADGGEEISCKFDIGDEGKWGFDVGKFDPSREIVIDPLIYSTYIGGTGNDFGYNIVVDNNNFPIIAGLTLSFDFPTTVGVYNRSLVGKTDLFITKFSHDGKNLLFSTYLGGSNDDGLGFDSIFIDKNIFISGYSNSVDFPITLNAYQNTNNGNYDAFFLILNPNGTSLIYSTYFGGSNLDTINVFQKTFYGKLLVGGYTMSSDLPITSNAYSTIYRGNNDAFIALFLFNGSIFYSSYIGGTNIDYLYGVKIDANENILITGRTMSSNFPTSSTAFDRTWNGNNDVFISKLNISLNSSSLIFSTYLGGKGSDQVYSGFDIGSDDSIYICITTSSSDFPVTNNVFDNAYNDGSSDIALSKLDPSGSRLLFSTFLGGSDGEVAYSMKLTEKDNPVVMGYTLSSDFPNPFNFSISGGKEIFVAKFDSSGSILYHTEFLGGSDDDVPYAMVLDSKLNAYLTGYTKSSDFPVNNSSFDQTFNQGTYDAFLAVINVDILKPIADAGPDIVTDEDRVLCFNGSSSHDDESIVNYTWTIRDRFGVSSFYESVTPYNFTSPGLFQVELNVTDIAGNWGTDTALIYVIDRTKPDANAGPDFTVDEDTPAFLFGNRSTDNGMMVSYNWSFRDGVKSVTLSGMNAYYVFEDPGVYSIELNVTDLGGNWDTDIVNITVMDVTRPFADAGPDLHISQGDVAFFNGSGCDDNVMITNYTWSIENEHLYGYLVSYQFQNAGGIPVTLKVTDGSFNWGEDAATIWVRDTEHPVADAGGDRIVEANSMVILNGSASSDNVGITAYRWTVEVEGEQIESEEGVFSHVFANVGLYEITLNVSDSEGNWDVDRVSVRVMDTQKPLASAGSDRIVNEDTSMTFDASGSTDNTGIASWKWTIRDSVYDIDLEGVKVNYTFEEPGLFSAILKVADIAGNTDTVEIEITVLDITDPIPDLRCDPEIDQGVRWNYDGSASTDNVGIANWTWTVEGNSEVIRLYGKSGYLFFPYPGSYHVTMTVTDEAGNSGSISAELKVMDIEPPVARASGINVLTVGSEAIFDGTGSTDNVGIVNWTWVISGGGDNVTLYGMTCRHSFDEPGIYLVTLTVTDGEGARSSDKIRIAVEDDEGIDRGSVKEESSFIPYVAMGILVGIILVLIALLVRRRPEKGSTLADPDTESWE